MPGLMAPEYDRTACGQEGRLGYVYENQEPLRATPRLRIV